RREEGGYSGCDSGRRVSDFGAVRTTCVGCATGGGGAVRRTFVTRWIAVEVLLSTGTSMDTSGGGTNGGGVSIFGGGGGGGSSVFGASSIMRVSIGPRTTSTRCFDRPELST